MSLITTAFETAAKARARVLGIEGHPTVVMPHPLASRTQAEVAELAEALVHRVAGGLTRAVP